jgi:DNA (cytosine-5)-methyltransferase 1
VPDALTVGSLFAGIGGFDLGFERAGMRTVWFCEQDPFCQRVLARHWPGVPVFPDVRALDGAAAGRVDVLCGGFPCQDLSVAGRGAGLDGERSGLWGEYARLIRDLRPRYVVVENVAALLARGMGRVLGDLAACGYDAEWDCIPASAVGAPHRRDRVWLVAYPQRDAVRVEPGWRRGEGRAGTALAAVDGEERPVADAEVVAIRPGLRPDEPRRVGRGRPGDRGGTDGDWWATEPDVGRVADGVPQRVDRLRALGNSLVPQIAEHIGRRIVEWER